MRLEGVVLDQAGAPIAGAEVALSAGSLAILQIKTDTSGRFVLHTVSPEVDTLTVRARGFTTYKQKWSAIERDAARTENLPPTENNLRRLEIVLAPAPIAEEVIVTATRTETRLGDTAASVVVLSSEEIRVSAAATLDDTLRQVPGFSLFRRSGSRTANPTAQGVSLRGVGASGASRAVVLLDGIPINDPFGGWVYWGRVSREAVSRMEVVGGGASTLYVSGALGGVINIITRRTDAPGLSLEASYGSQRTGEASFFASGRTGRWGASLAAESFRTDGYILVDEQSRGSIDTPAGSRRAALDLTLDRALAKSGRAFVRGSVFGEARTNGTPLQTNRTHLRQLSAGVDWLSSAFGSLAVRAYGGTQVFDQNFSAVSAERNSETLTRVQRVPVQVVGFTSQWSRAFGAKHTLVVGLEAREVRGASDELVFVAGRPSSLIGAGGRERTIGVFAEDIIQVTSRLSLIAAARFDRWRNYAALQATQPLAPSRATTVTAFPDRSETAFSPQLSLLYKVSDNVSLSATMNRAFRAPTLNELYRSFRVGDVVTLANEQLRAERLTGGETGASVNSFNRKLTARGTFFWMEITRPIANVTLSVTPSLVTRQRQNLGRTRSRGIEIENEIHLTNYWTVSSGYLFADATVLRFPANTTLEGLLIPQVPRHQFNFQARYASTSGTTVAVQGRASSAQFDDDQNRLPLDRYFTLDALASRRLTRHIEAFITAENLFNQRYAIGRTPVQTIGPPLFVRFGFRLRLGSR